MSEPNDQVRDRIQRCDSCVLESRVMEPGHFPHPDGAHLPAPSSELAAGPRENCSSECLATEKEVDSFRY